MTEFYLTGNTKYDYYSSHRALLIWLQFKVICQWKTITIVTKISDIPVVLE